MTTLKKAKKIADLMPDQQVRVLVDAAKKTEIRSVRGNTEDMM